MQTQQANLFTRDDTFFGVCQGLGEDLGVNPNLFRLVIPVPLFFFPVQTIVGYFAVGLVVLALRLIFPNPSLSAQVQQEDRAAIVEQHEESAQAGQRLEEPTDLTGLTPVTATAYGKEETVPLAA